MKLQVILEPSEEGGFTVFVPSLPGCISEGESRDEALSNIKKAIALYLEPIEKTLEERRKLIESGQATFVTIDSLRTICHENSHSHH